jgi:hypothetical protein
MTVFLSQENAQYISSMFKKFMNDKYKFSYASVISDNDYYKLLGNYMNNVYNNYNTTKNTTAMNFITISDLKKHFLEKYINKEEVKIDTSAVVFNYEDDTLETIKEEPFFSEDSEFFNKLQKLELTRKTFVPSLSAGNISAPTIETNNPIYSASAQVPNTISTVYMPVPVKIGKEIKIYSWQRDWTSEIYRNNFTWKGPLPKLIDSTTTRIGCLICQTHILQETNMISLIIEGANKDEISISVIPSHSVGEYTIFRPILESLSYLKLLALPWKISLDSGDGMKLNLGKDGISYNIIEESENYTSILLPDNNFCGLGDSLRIFDEITKKISVSTVLKIRENAIDISGKIKNNGKLLNYSRQISIILEITTNDHKN